MAVERYSTSLHGWIESCGVFHPNVLISSTSLARCLRELDERDKAITLLKTIILQVRQNMEESVNSNQLGDQRTALGYVKPKAGESWDPKSLRNYLALERSLCVSKWWMAVCTLEKDQGQESLELCVDLLTTSSVSLQRCLLYADDVGNENSVVRLKSECERLQLVIKEELSRLHAIIHKKFPAKKVGDKHGVQSYLPSISDEIVRKFGLATGASEVEYEGFKPDIAAKRQIAEKYVKAVQLHGSEVVREDVPKPVSKEKKKDVLAKYCPPKAQTEIKSHQYPISKINKSSITSKYMVAVKSTERDGNEESLQPSGIAAMAAAAALKKNNSEGVGGGGGIAAMAAAAALKKSQAKKKEVDDGSDLPPSGIAAMAAAAALKKSQAKKKESDDGGALPPSGIAAMAAAAAMKKNKDKSNNMNEDPTGGGGGNIAAMAAAAALKKSQSRK